MARKCKEHGVIQTTANGRVVWKSMLGSKVAFYGSAEDSCQGILELSTAVIEAFKLKGEDRCVVIEEYENSRGVAVIVDVGTPEYWRGYIAKLAAERAGRVAS